MGQSNPVPSHTMKVLFVFALALAATQALDVETEWEAFKVKYEKGFLSATHHDERKAIFAANLKRIEKHNAEHAEGKHSYWLGVNQFADLTNDEFVNLHTGFRAVEPEMETADLSGMAAPLTMDWRDNGAVTPVKNQGQCGSCWAFSTIGTVEGALAISSGNLVSLSEQNLMDCDSNNNACNGGNPYIALQYIMSNGGVDTEANYPYEMRKSYSGTPTPTLMPSLVPSACPSALSLTWSVPSPWSPPPSPSTPPTTPSSCTLVVSMMSPTAPATPLTTVSWLSDTVARVARTTGSSRTPGAPSGVRLDTSRCPRERTTSAVLPPWPATPRPNLPEPQYAHVALLSFILLFSNWTS